MPGPPTPPGYVAVVLTCRTEGCGNADIPIETVVPPDVSEFVCGVCGQEITDIDTAPDQPTPTGDDDDPPAP